MMIILIHAKLPIFMNPRKFIHAKISTFTVGQKVGKVGKAFPTFIFINPLVANIQGCKSGSMKKSEIIQ